MLSRAEKRWLWLIRLKRGAGGCVALCFMHVEAGCGGVQQPRVALIKADNIVAKLSRVWNESALFITVS